MPKKPHIIINLKQRLKDIRHDTYTKIKDAIKQYHESNGSSNPNARWKYVFVDEKTLPSFEESKIVTDILGISIEELMDPTFSLAQKDFDNMSRDRQEAAAEYGFKMPGHAA